MARGKVDIELIDPEEAKMDTLDIVCSPINTSN